jgi:hypothetical protein
MASNNDMYPEVGGEVLIPKKRVNGSINNNDEYPEVGGNIILAARNTVGRKSRRASRKNRKSRKSRRTVYRKNRRNSRRNSTELNMMGGAYDAGKLNLLQGEQYQKIHMNQHGGALPTVGAPLSQIEGSLLDSSLRASARVGPLDSSLGEIRGMSDIDAPAVPAQKGGRRRGSRRSSRKNSRKNRKGSRKNSRKSSRKNSRKNRKGSRRQRGGALSGAPLSAPSMLLNPYQAAKAGTADFSNPLLKA